MPEQTSPEHPTFFANIATVHVAPDEVSFEFRRLTPPHVEVWVATQKGTQPSPPVTDDEIFAQKPIARVVLTFRAAKNLRDNLNKLLPTFEEARKRGE